MSEEYGSPPQYGRIARPTGYLPLNTEDAHPMATHGKGVLNTLIKSRSHTSLTNLHRRPSSFREGRDTPEVFDEENSGLERFRRNSREFDESDDFKRSEERRLSDLLNGPQMRSQRLIGNSNPRYRWEKYWKTEEELKKMKKPMLVNNKGIFTESLLISIDANTMNERIFLYNNIYISTASWTLHCPMIC